MKLNKKGWSTTEMLALTAGLFIALLVSIYFISKLYGSFDNAVKNKKYFELETRLESASRKYVLLNNIQLVDNYLISYKTLKDAGLINDLDDAYGNPCSGYVIVNVIDGFDYHNAYITCNNYQTEK
jgi:hypothetical protein